MSSAAMAAVLVPALFAFVVAAIREPIRLALPVYAALLPFGQGIPTGLPGAFGSLSSILGIVLIFGLLVQLMTTRRAAPQLPATVPVWLGLLAAAGVSIFWSIGPQATALGAAGLGSLVLLYVLIAMVGVTREEFDRVGDAIVLAGVAAACYGLLELVFLGGLPTNDQGGSARFGNELLGPNNQAAALLLPLAIALGRVMLRSRGPRWLNVAAVAVMLFGILMTGSRGGLIALLVTLAVLVFYAPRNRAVMLTFAAGMLAAVVLVLAFNPAGIGQRQVNGDDSSGRTEIWAVAAHACPTYCLAGSGWGTFPEVYKEQQSSVPEAKVLRRGTAYQPHNIWILVGIEVGLAGVILLTFGLGLTVWTAARLPAALRAPPLAAVLGTVTSGFFLTNFEYKFFWMALIYVVLAQNVAAAEARTRPKPEPVASLAA